MPGWIWLSNLNSATFKGLQNLKEINLCYNRISLIETGAFYNLNVKMFYLNNNRLVEFDFLNLTANSVFLHDNLLHYLLINSNVENVFGEFNRISVIENATRSVKSDKNIRIKYV